MAGFGLIFDSILAGFGLILIRFGLIWAGFRLDLQCIHPSRRFRRFVKFKQVLIGSRSCRAMAMADTRAEHLLGPPQDLPRTSPGPPRNFLGPPKDFLGPGTS